MSERRMSTMSIGSTFFFDNVDDDLDDDDRGGDDDDGDQIENGDILKWECCAL